MASEVIDRARASYRERAWAAAYADFHAADDESPLAIDDLEQLAVTAYLIGKDDDSLELWARAHRDCLRLDDAERAARCGFWLAFHLLLRGDIARSGGWVARIERLLDDRQLDCAVQGYVMVVNGLVALDADDVDHAYGLFTRATDIAARFTDPDLSAIARLSTGEALIQRHAVAQGVRLLDEVMAGVITDEVSPVVVGVLYCATILCCQKIFDIRRETEWTAALTDWCAAQPDLVPFRGQCLVHRSEIMQLHGAWADAEAEAQRACELLSGVPFSVAGMAYYQCGELHRLRGEYEQAEAAYEKASEWGHEPQPGLSLLRLGQGKVDLAQAAIRRIVDESRAVFGAGGGAVRSRLLPAFVEIMIEAHDLEAAGAGADELSALAAGFDAPLVHALAAHARGSVVLATGDARSALDPLRQAYVTWQQLQAPHDTAKVRVLIGMACRQLGDYDTARMHLEAARTAFRRLGAAPDVARLERLLVRVAPEAAGLLTAREIEVLQHVAVGKTNRDIAADLSLSEKTVARHVSNILTKLGLASRSAATAYAYEHDLLQGTTT